MYRTHGLSRTPTHNTWVNMIQRCTNPNHTFFAEYGGRGISVCARWRDSFAAFLADMGERPEGTTLDRIDNNGHYEPQNCRWATPTTQVRNSRRSDLGFVAVCLIRHMRRRGASCADVSHAFGVSKSQISRVSKRTRWTDLFHPETGLRTPVAATAQKDI